MQIQNFGAFWGKLADLTPAQQERTAHEFHRIAVAQDGIDCAIRLERFFDVTGKKELIVHVAAGAMSELCALRIVNTYRRFDVRAAAKKNTNQWIVRFAWQDPD